MQNIEHTRRSGEVGGLVQACLSVYDPWYPVFLMPLESVLMESALVAPATCVLVGNPCMRWSGLRANSDIHDLNG